MKESKELQDLKLWKNWQVELMIVPKNSRCDTEALPRKDRARNRIIVEDASRVHMKEKQPCEEDV